MFIKEFNVEPAGTDYSGIEITTSDCLRLEGSQYVMYYGWNSDNFNYDSLEIISDEKAKKLLAEV